MLNTFDWEEYSLEERVGIREAVVIYQRVFWGTLKKENDVQLERCAKNRELRNLRPFPVS